MELRASAFAERANEFSVALLPLVAAVADRESKRTGINVPARETHSEIAAGRCVGRRELVTETALVAENTERALAGVATGEHEIFVVIEQRANVVVQHAVEETGFDYLH